MSRESLQRESTRLKLQLEDSATEAEVITDFRKHPGWATVESIMADYADRSHGAFLEGSKPADEYRAECRVMEFLKGVMEAVATQGEAAARELLDRGWNE